ncbi:hypothetical protein IWQ62_000989 [Dispira parvispora]|uniref:Uncharacterized protein n=1 Tax=Dispira parvispora TaxID=1520584 RepID=A0A9W8AX61_9FUNG|nr:hypothetical protein IWQ62_000989 [Dispira parvispora]
MKAYRVPFIIVLCILATVPSTLPARLGNSLASSPRSNGDPNAINRNGDLFLKKYESLMFGRGWEGVPFEIADIEIISVLFKEEIRYSKYKRTYPLLTRTEDNFDDRDLVNVFIKQPLILAYVTGNWELVLKTLKTIDKLTDGMATKEISPENEVLRRAVAMQVMTISAIAVFRKDYYLLEELVAMMNDECKGFVDEAKFAVVAIIAEFVFAKDDRKFARYRYQIFEEVKESADEMGKIQGVPAFNDCLHLFNMHIALGAIYGQFRNTRSEDKDNKCSEYYFIGVNTPTSGTNMQLEDFINGYAPPSQEGASDL